MKDNKVFKAGDKVLCIDEMGKEIQGTIIDPQFWRIEDSHNKEWDIFYFVDSSFKLYGA